MKQDECIFCKIIKKQIPSDIVYEDDKVMAFKDINPEAPVHIVIIPREHIVDLNCLKQDESEIIGHIFMVAKQIAKTLGVDEEGYRIINNCGKHGGQTVGHLHFHLLGGKMLKLSLG